MINYYMIEIKRDGCIWQCFCCCNYQDTAIAQATELSTMMLNNDFPHDEERFPIRFNAVRVVDFISCSTILLYENDKEYCSEEVDWLQEGF